VEPGLSSRFKLAIRNPETGDCSANSAAEGIRLASISQKFTIKHRFIAHNPATVYLRKKQIRQGDS